MRPALLLLLSLTATQARAQGTDDGARSVALAGAGVANGRDAWAESNPAAWATVGERTVSLFAAQAFGLTELRTIAARTVWPTPAAVAAVAIRSCGFSDYRELRASVGFARTAPIAAGRRVALGIRADYHAIQISGFPTGSVIDLAAGLQVDVTPSVTAGIAARNALSVARSDSAELRTPLALSPVAAFGVAVRPAASTLLALDLEKDLDFQPLIRAGLEFSPVRVVTLRAGSAVPVAAAGVTRVAFGAGFAAGPLTLDAAVDWHPELGPSPAFGLSARF